MRAIRVSGTALAALALVLATARAGQVRFPPDSYPVGRGTHVLVDVAPSQLTARPETPDSIAFFLPREWSVDGRGVARECSRAQAAAQRCPASSKIGFGHVVVQLAGYLFPGGRTEGVAYVTAFLGPPKVPGDPASIVLETRLLGGAPVIAVARKYLGARFKPRSSITGRVILVRRGTYGLEASFAPMPGAITVAPALQRLGASAQVTRFKLEIGHVRRVRREFTRVEHVVGPNGPTTLIVHDHILVGYHLFNTAPGCPRSGIWSWQVLVGFPEGQHSIKGATKCG